ncbi:GNAT family N-acetyltransferase [Limnobaculum xujianqingii]|uniref:GNAT family N-acetyltransferase n=1 Tax=Limnobaculum xujianqingii TaxID=2738837 RepID=UPI0015BFD07D|nr:GNAT family N-acetyltransferase [Limnobaculum xujianqingii]
MTGEIANYSIGLAAVADIPFIASIEAAAATMFPESVLPAAQRQETTPIGLLQQAQAEKRLWVAQQDGQPVGFLLADRVGEWGWVQEVSVHPDAGGRGIGKQLIMQVLEWSCQQQCQYVGLTTFRDVAWNGPFYQRLGFMAFDRLPTPEFLQQALAGEREWSRFCRVAMYYPLKPQ